MSHPFPRPLVLGHRGAPGDAPENTLRSFALAMEQGADGVEVDVRVARDGVPVVVHDPAMAREGGRPVVVAERDWPALQQLSASRLSSFEQACSWAAAAGAWVNVELKVPGAEGAVLAELRRTGLLPRCFLSSFDAGVVAEVGRRAPESVRFLLLEAWDAEAHRLVVESGAAGVCLAVDAADALTLEVLHNEDLPVVVWTVNDRARMVELFRAGVAGIITDVPALAVAARREAGV
jgi:glycerophosphoryl diester phosphodiesterase